MKHALALFGLSYLIFACSATLPKEPAMVIEAGSECIYAQKAAAYKKCAVDNAPNRAAYESCKGQVDRAFKPIYDAIEQYRCLLDDGECKEGE